MIKDRERIIKRVAEKLPLWSHEDFIAKIAEIAVNECFEEAANVAASWIVPMCDDPTAEEITLRLQKIARNKE